MQTNEHIIVLVSCVNKAQAEQIAEYLLKEKLVACVQMQDVKSYYTWKDKLEKSIEVSLSMKTRAEHFTKIQTAVLAEHSYEVPEIVAIPIVNALPAYLAWIDEVVENF